MLLVQGGLGACAMQDVAAAAKVDRSTLYRRWPSRAALVLEAIGAQVESEIPLPDTGSLIGDLGQALGGLAAFLNSPVGWAALGAAIEGEGDPEAVALKTAWWRRRRAAIEPLFRRAMARGEIDPGLDWEALLASLAGTLYFRRIVAGEPIDRAWIARILAAVIEPRLRV